MKPKGIIKLVVYTDEDIMNMEMDEHIEIFKKAIKERSFNHIKLVNLPKKVKLSRRERVLLDPLAASQRK
jgi:hypothetical protein